MITRPEAQVPRHLGTNLRGRFLLGLWTHVHEAVQMHSGSLGAGKVRSPFTVPRIELKDVRTSTVL